MANDREERGRKLCEVSRLESLNRLNLPISTTFQS